MVCLADPKRRNQPAQQLGLYDLGGPCLGIGIRGAGNIICTISSPSQPDLTSTIRRFARPRSTWRGSGSYSRGDGFRLDGGEFLISRRGISRDNPPCRRSSPWWRAWLGPQPFTPIRITSIQRHPGESRLSRGSAPPHRPYPGAEMFGEMGPTATSWRPHLIGGLYRGGPAAGIWPILFELLPPPLHGAGIRRVVEEVRGANRTGMALMGAG